MAGSRAVRRSLRSRRIVAGVPRPPVEQHLVRDHRPSAGTTQTFPYLVRNIRHCYPLPVVIVLVGRGFSSGAVDWLQGQVDGQTLLAVTFTEDFARGVRRSLAG